MLGIALLSMVSCAYNKKELPEPVVDDGGNEVAKKVSVNVLSGSFSPANVTINSGDTVEWVNNSGFHYIDGSQATYPNNPSFFDNADDVGNNWTYSIVLTQTGSYEYLCGVHSSTMFGTITVE